MILEILLVASMSTTDWKAVFAGEGVEHPSMTTQLTPEEATKAMADGYKIVTGRKPSKEVLALMVGQWALETGNGKSMRNYNFGNKKAVGNDNYQYFRCSEVINGVEMFFDPPSPECRFASYSTPEEGAAAYVRLLKNHDNWWNGLHTKTVNGFIDGLTTPPAYFTANPSTYANALNNRMNAFFPHAEKYASSGGFGSVLALGAGIGLSWLGFKDYSSKQSVIKQNLRRLRKVVK